MKLVLFGNGPFASVAWYWLSHDSPFTVAGFTVDETYLRGASHHGLPVVPFETVEQHFYPNDHHLLITIGPAQNNALRAEKSAAAKAKGYSLANYLSSRAIVPPDLVLHENSMIFEGAVIQPFATIGRNVIVRSGAQISHHVTIDDDCFVASGACIGGGAIIRARCFLGLNSTVFNDIEVAAGCTIAAGAVLQRDAKQTGTYMGVPARLRRDDVRATDQV
jgi:sugar O-acyltransferase (sialic acid O-acetyltransferase NeuD family)